MIRSFMVCGMAALLVMAVPGVAQDTSLTPSLPTARWITLGTSGGPPIQAERSQIANALVVGDAVYLFDVGNGVRRQMVMAKLPESKVRAVFLSHHHPDHNADMGIVMIAHWLYGRGVMTVTGPEGTKTLIDGLVAANAATVLASFSTAGPAKPALADTVKGVEITEPVDTPRLVYQDANISVEAINVPHYQDPPSVPLPRMPQAVAYRVTAGGRTFVYSGDTGPTDQLTKLAKGADVLISEVVEPAAITFQLNRIMAQAPAMVREGIIRGMTKNHLVPTEVGRIAKSADVKQVVLTHFVPSPETINESNTYVKGVQAVYRGKVTMANDLDEF